MVHGVPQQHDLHRRCPGRLSGCRGPIADLETNNFSGEFAFHDCLRRSWALSGTAGGALLLIISRQRRGAARDCWETAGGMLGDCQDCCNTAGELLGDCQGLMRDCWGTAGRLSQYETRDEKKKGIDKRSWERRTAVLENIELVDEAMKDLL